MPARHPDRTCAGLSDHAPVRAPARTLFRVARTTAFVALATGMVVAISACSSFSPSTNNAGATSSSSPNSSASTTATTGATTAPSGKASSTATQTPTDPPTPVTMSCSSVITQQQLYNFNPNFTANSGYKPSSGSVQASATAQQGVACGWLNESGSGSVQISVAHPAASQSTILSGEAAEQASPVPTYGAAPDVTGYFSADNHTAQVFTKGYWITVASPLFAEPGDAAPLVADVIGNLP